MLISVIRISAKSHISAPLEGMLTDLLWNWDQNKHFITDLLFPVKVCRKVLKFWNQPVFRLPACLPAVRPTSSGWIGPIFSHNTEYRLTNRSFCGGFHSCWRLVSGSNLLVCLYLAVCCYWLLLLLLLIW